MRIHPSAYQALAGKTASLDECLALMARVWDAFEDATLADVEADAIAAGFAEADVQRQVEWYRHALRERREAGLATARLMLEAGATNLQ